MTQQKQNHVPETSTPQDQKTTQSHYDFEECLAFLQQKGKEQFGQHFVIGKEDEYMVYRLLIYFLGDEINAPKHKIDLRKGILLSGPVGCGKTALMTLMKYYAPTSQVYLLKSCRDISFEFIKDGYEVIQRYSHQSFVRNGQHEIPKVYCFDDLGAESNIKYFGNECNCMGEILLSRYDLFISRALKTHITTNLSATEIESFYGNRVRSRMREMFNLLSFNENTHDKRK